MKKLTVVISVLFLAFCASAQGLRYADSKHWMIDAEIGFNTDGYEAAVGVSWWPVSGFGVKLAAGVAGEMYGFGNWWDDYYYDYEEYAERFKLMPSLELRSPALVRFNSYGSTLHIFANPGLVISPGAAGSRDADWFSWQLRGGIELDINDAVIRLGYGYSNYNLYSGDPYSHNPLPDEIKRKTKDGFLSVGYRF